MPRKRKRKQKAKGKSRQIASRAASAIFSDESDESNTSTSAPIRVTPRRSAKTRKRGKTVKAKTSAKSANDVRVGKKQTYVTPKRKKPEEQVEEDYDNASDGEEQLHGPCGEPLFGQDPPPARFRKLIGELVALEFDVKGHADLVLFTGVVESYNQSKDTFEVCGVAF